MCLREHIFNLFTGPDIPFRNIVFTHGSFPLFAQTFSFTYSFHDRKGKAAFYPHADEIDHNIISCTDCSRNRCFSFFDQCLCISQPYVCTMRQSGNTYQVRKIFRFRINKHLHGKICTKLRYTQTSELAASNILRFDSQCIRTCK